MSSLAVSQNAAVIVRCNVPHVHVTKPHQKVDIFTTGHSEEAEQAESPRAYTGLEKEDLSNLIFFFFPLSVWRICLWTLILPAVMALLELSTVQRKTQEMLMKCADGFVPALCTEKVESQHWCKNVNW